MAELQSLVAEVMRRNPITVAALEDQESVAHKIAKYNLLAVPVLEQDERVVGFVTVDNVIDALIEEQTEDIMRMAAVEPGALDRPYFDNSIARVVRKRVDWLLLLFVAETFTGTVLRYFESELAAVVALSFFIPLLIGTGGNAGSQTVTTITRGIALGEIRLRELWRVLGRETSIGAAIGVLIAVVAFGRALLWGSSIELTLTVSISVLAICAWSTTIGSLIPLMATVQDRSGGTFGAADRDTRGRHRAGDLFQDRQGDPASVMQPHCRDQRVRAPGRCKRQRRVRARPVQGSSLFGLIRYFSPEACLT